MIITISQLIDFSLFQTWHVYDTGPVTTGRSPLLCLPPIAGTADVFFKQCLGERGRGLARPESVMNLVSALSARGHRVLSVSWPVYWTHEAWCHGLAQLLDQLGLERIHILGAALGGFLAQKFAEVTRDCPRVASLILCNTFTGMVGSKRNTFYKCYFFRHGHI